MTVDDVISVVVVGALVVVFAVTGYLAFRPPREVPPERVSRRAVAYCESLEHEDEEAW